MKYQSTRNVSLEPRLFTFEQVVMTGMAPDGGLFVPVEIPRLPQDFLERWKDLDFCGLCCEIFPLFIGEESMTKAEISMLVEKAFASNFPLKHGVEGVLSHDVVALRKLGQSQQTNTFLLELFHGPTFAFKDIALQFLGQLFEFFLSRRKDADQSKMTVVCATSGDTGSAAIESIRGKPSMDIFVLHPLDRISPVQKAQMTSVRDENVFNLALKGTFDDCQRVVKEMFADTKWQRESGVKLGAVNSINWARILAQMVYYFYAYFAICRNLPNETTPVKVRFSVPTGNFGNVLASFYARCLGLPIEELLIGTNQNDILHRFFTTGVYERRGVEMTLSPAMDIQVSSNFERWLWHFCQDHIQSSVRQFTNEERKRMAAECVCNWMKSLAEHGRFSTTDPLPVALDFTGGKALLERAKLNFSSSRVDDLTIKDALKRYAEMKPAVILDPHTAVGVVCAERNAAPPGVYTVCLATAHPIKFVGSVASALTSQSISMEDIERDVLNGNVDISGLEVPESLRGLLDKETRCATIENSKEAVENYIVKQTQLCKTEP